MPPCRKLQDRQIRVYQTPKGLFIERLKPAFETQLISSLTVEVKRDRRDKGDREKIGDQQSDNQSRNQRPKNLLRKIPGKQKREHDSDGRHSTGKNRPNNLLSPLNNSRLQIFFHFGQMALDVFEDDDSVIDQHPQCKNNCRVDNYVQFPPEHPDDCNGGKKDHRD